MMHLLTLVHRWLGILFCLLFAMWFASGIVMHFVPFPGLTDRERIEGLAPIDISGSLARPAEVVTATAIAGVTRLRLFERLDGPVYVATGPFGFAAVRADGLSDAMVSTPDLALAIAVDHAHRRQFDATHATFVELEAYDQWTVPNSFDRHRPLYRIALNDEPGTELYVSSTTGEIVCDTTRRERRWNYVGSMAHWIYPEILRSRSRVWNTTVWTVSLIALMVAISGSVLGLLRIRLERYWLVSPLHGWHAWHHVLGLCCMTFVLSWSFSGWLSMDSGRLFSTGRLTGAEVAVAASEPAWSFPLMQDLPRNSMQVREIEWFALGDRPYVRMRIGLREQYLLSGDGNGGAPAPRREFLQPDEINTFVTRLAPDCEPSAVITSGDNYAVAASIPGGPVYRSICGDVWFHVDGASGAILERLDPSRRTYRWLYGALHTLDLPALVARPILRTTLIVVLCCFGLVFSLTGVFIGWQRLRLIHRSYGRPVGSLDHHGP